MGQIYEAPKGIVPPSFRLSHEDYNKACDKYEQDISDWAKKNGKGPHKGKIIRFQVADGYASYVVVSLRPIKLIHMDHIDGYNQPYIERLTAKDITDRIRMSESVAGIFKKG